MANKVLKVDSQLADLAITAQQLLSYARDRRVWLFIGDLGAGKTTLIKAICKELGVKDVVTSPTFGLVHAYCLPNDEPVYHVDAYRLQNNEEMAVELQSYLDTGYYCFVEWPSQVRAINWGTHMEITLSYQASDKRYIEAKLKGS